MCNLISMKLFTFSTSLQFLAPCGHPKSGENFVLFTDLFYPMLEILLQTSKKGKATMKRCPYMLDPLAEEGTQCW